MKSLGDAYFQHLRTGIALMLQYRASEVIWLIGNVLEPLVYLVVWSTVARSSGGGVGGYDTREFAAYYIVFMLVDQVTFTWVLYEFDNRIRTGEFSAILLQPIHPIHMDIADNISSKIVSLPFTVAAAVGMTVLFRPALKPSLWVTVVFVPVLCLAFLVRFLVEWTLGLAAFWTTRINAINQIHHMALLFFSGQIAPYELLPRPLQWASSVLPFRWTLGFPVELILGRLTPNQVLTGIAAQAVWLVAALALLKIAWRASLKKYSAVGG